MKGGGGFGSKPKALMCFICGREFGTHSLEIHIRQCEKKNNYKGTIPESYEILFEKINSGVKLTEQDYNLMNNKANDDYKEKTLVPCPNCARRFLADRLEVHLRSCKPTSGSLKGPTSFKSPDKIKSNSLSLSVSGEGANKMMQKLSLSSQKKPKFVVCYVCGREFGKHSIEIHLEQCMDKHFKDEIGRGVPKSKIKTPNPPEELLVIIEKSKNKEEVSDEEISVYNQLAMEIYKDISMKQCNNCGRRFAADRVDVHLKSCNPEQMSSNQKQNRMPGMRPKMHMCPLCGKEFGSMSLEIHIKTCVVKFNREQENLPKNQRRSAESILEKYKAIEQGFKSQGDYNVDSMNNEAFNVFNKEALIACDNCGRTFLPDRLLVHQRSCKTKK